MSDKPSIMYILQSRKFWAFVTAFVGLGFASYQNDGVITAAEIEKLVYLVIAYIASVALEDGLANHNAGKTTISTPAPNVDISTSDTPAKPTVTNQGLL